ncbi:hypothetical protein Ancab_001936 [Ancistrocladus abbreviatus]
MGQVISTVLRWFFGGRKGNKRQLQGKERGNEQISHEIPSCYIDIDAISNCSPPCQLNPPSFPLSLKLEGSKRTLKEPLLGDSHDAIGMQRNDHVAIEKLHEGSERTLEGLLLGNSHDAIGMQRYDHDAITMLQLEGSGRTVKELLPRDSHDVIGMQRDDHVAIEMLQEGFERTLKELLLGNSHYATSMQRHDHVAIAMLQEGSERTLKEPLLGNSHDAIGMERYDPIAIAMLQEDYERTLKEPLLGNSNDAIGGNGESCTVQVVDCNNIIDVEEDARETICKEEIVKDVFVSKEELLLAEEECLGKLEVIASEELLIEKRKRTRSKKKKEKLLIDSPIGGNGEGRSIGAYRSTHTMLLVGEGDFSFSTSLALAFGFAGNMVATSLNSREFLSKNYGKATSNILELTSRGCKVMHGVDATKMASFTSFKAMKFDRVVFNFPHAGFFRPNEPRECQIRKHQALVRSFMKNAKKMVNKDGEIHITHKSTGYFKEWNIEMLASNQGLRLIEVRDFNYKDYPGYNTKYGFGGDKNFNCNPSKAYKLGLKCY